MLPTLLLLMAMIFGGDALPVMAHVHAEAESTLHATGHAADLPDLSHAVDAGAVANAAGDADDPAAPDVSTEVHHHCTASLASVGPVLVNWSVIGAVQHTLLPQNDRRSRAIPPPQEPPLA